MDQHVFKFFTSYYGRRGLPFRRCLGTTPVIPKDFKGAYDKRLAPSSTMIRDLRSLDIATPLMPKYQEELKSWKENYFQWIGRKIAPLDAAKLVDGRIILSHEALGLSHRVFIREWLEFHGILVQAAEWGGESEDEIDQKAFPFGQKPRQPGAT